MRAALIALPLALVLVACQGEQPVNTTTETKAKAVQQPPVSASPPVETVTEPPLETPTATQEAAKPEPVSEPAKTAPPAATPTVTVAAVAPNVQPGILPQGPGRNVAQRMCSSCHSLVLVTQTGHTEAEWDSIVARMEDNGMMASPEDIDTVITYLGKALPPR